MADLGDMQELLAPSFKPFIDSAMNLISEKQKMAESLKQITIDAEIKILEVINIAQAKLEQKQKQDIKLPTPSKPQTISVSSSDDLVLKKQGTLGSTGKQGTLFATREGYHLDPSHTLEKDYEFPAKEALNYDNQIVGFIHNPKGWKGMNIIMSDGTKSQLPMGANYSEVKIQPEGAIVKRIVVFGNHEFGGVEFYDRNGTKILSAGYYEPT